MAFAMAINNLMEAVGKPGCPICRLFRQASRRAIESFLWENVNEPDVRKGILDSYGFCPPHTRLMVAQEMFSSSVPLGTNIIYEHLGRVVAGELKALRPGSASAAVGGQLRGLMRSVGLSRGEEDLPLPPRGPCPACQSGDNGATNGLHVLCEEIQRAESGGNEDVRKAYLASDGLCLQHLRQAIGSHSEKFPDAVRLLIDETVERLESQSRHMKEFIRKSNWSYREEKVIEEEDLAWRKTLTFFTGFAGDTFNHKIEE
jgi:hypothetical protein